VSSCQHMISTRKYRTDTQIFYSSAG